MLVIAPTSYVPCNLQANTNKTAYCQNAACIEDVERMV